MGKLVLKDRREIYQPTKTSAPNPLEGKDRILDKTKPDDGCHCLAMPPCPAKIQFETLR